jgi:hypothetical protein
VQHALFVALGVNMWMPLFGPAAHAGVVRQPRQARLHRRRRLLGAVLANVLLWTETPLYDGYDVADRAADQSAAASLMMVEGSILTLVCFGWLFLRAARDNEERQQLVELGADPDPRRPRGRRRAGRRVAIPLRAPGVYRRARRGDEHGCRTPGERDQERSPQMSPSLMSKVAQFARSPQGRRMAETATRRARDPKTRRQVEQVRARLMKRGGGGPPR